VTQIDKIVIALKNLGGEGYLKNIYLEYENITSSPLSNTQKAGIRKCIEDNSSDSKNFKGKDLFYSVYGIGKGAWGLREYQASQDDTELSQIKYKEDFSAFEGRKQAKEHIQRERSARLVRLAKTNFAHLHNGDLYCEICAFNFKEIYGEAGAGFIEAHHLKPISEMEEGEQTNIKDIMLVCSNCHRMLHRHKSWLKSPLALKKMFQRTK